MSVSPALSVLLLLLVEPGADRATEVRHPESMSRSRVHVQGPNATVDLHFQALSLLEVFPELDRKPDGALDPEELQESRPLIDAYLLQKFRVLRVDGQEERPLAGTVTALTAQATSELGPFELQNLDARLELAGDAAIEVLVVESVLFHETNPWHRDFSSLTWNDDGAVPHLFEGSETRWRFEPAHVRRPGVLARFARLGGEHALGLEHLAVPLALLVIARRWRGFLGCITTLAAANALTLTLAATGLVALPARLVELATSLTIAYLACDNLLRKEARDPWLEAGFFGLLHGLGSSAWLADALAGEVLFREALAGLGLGFWLGQLAAALLGLLLVKLVFRAWRRREPAAAGLVPPAVRSAVSLFVAALGFYWFLQRAGWIPWF